MGCLYGKRKTNNSFINNSFNNEQNSDEYASRETLKTIIDGNIIEMKRLENAIKKLEDEKKKLEDDNAILKEEKKNLEENNKKLINLNNGLNKNNINLTNQVAILQNQLNMFQTPNYINNIYGNCTNNFININQNNTFNNPKIKFKLQSGQEYFIPVNSSLKLKDILKELKRRINDFKNNDILLLYKGKDITEDFKGDKTFLSFNYDPESTILVS